VRGGQTGAALRAAVLLPWRASRGIFVGQLLITAAAGLAPVAAAWLLRSVIDSLTGSGRPADLPTLVVALAAAGGVQGVLTALGQYLAAQSGRAVERHATTELFGAVGGLVGLRRLEDPVFLDRLNMAQRVSMSGPAQAFTSTVNAVEPALTVTGFLGVLLVFSPVMAVVVLAATIPWVLAEAGVARRRAAMLEDTSHAARRLYFFANLLSSNSAAKEIRLFGLGPFFRRRLLDELRTIQRSGQRVDRREAVTYSLLTALSALVAGAGIWWAVHAAARGRLTVGDVALFIAALGSASSALTGIISNGAMAYQSVLMLRSYAAILAEDPDLVLAADPAPTRALRRGIQFDDVWFRYAPGLPWILHGVSFRVPCGESVALVGRNGAGKSTLVKLMCRFYDPDRGRILWDGVDLRDLDPAQLRDRISAVFQDYMSYELSARENIAVGDLALAADEALETAARRADIHDTLRALPKGYDTLLTRTYLDLADKQDPQTGVLLSGGQWQRVALARALLRGGRDLVILDEPSSGLDAEAEYEIHSSLRAHRDGRTTILISHRLNAVRDADTIVVLADGAITEQGDHGTLMARGGTYARLFCLQARGFADEAPDAVLSSLSGAIDHG
jgi:ATP-binding cassette, subfamily B, bacterial